MEEEEASQQVEIPLSVVTSLGGSNEKDGLQTSIKLDADELNTITFQEIKKKIGVSLGVPWTDISLFTGEYHTTARSTLGRPVYWG